MLYADLFDWWIATITWSIAFPIAISIYLYLHRKQRATAGRLIAGELRSMAGASLSDENGFP